MDGENLLWRKEEFATRATPVVFDNRVYVVCRHKPDTPQESEKTVCIKAETGELIWESIHNIYLSLQTIDHPASQLDCCLVHGVAPLDVVQREFSDISDAR